MDELSAVLVHPQKNGAEYIIDLFRQKGIDSVFMVPGAHIGGLIHELVLNKGMRTVICSHEGGAAFMADGYSRIKQVPGVVVTNGGAGLCNLITEITVAKAEYVPLIVISGDIPVPLARCQGFQESGDSGSNDLKITESITKYSCRVSHIEELPRILNKAFQICLQQPRGPVHIVIPYNLFLETIPSGSLMKPPENMPAQYKTPNMDKIDILLMSPQKVVLYAGESLNGSPELNLLKVLSEHYRLPVVTTFGAKGILPETHELNFGNAGFGGRKGANQLLLSEKLEGIIFLGTQLNERNTLNWNQNLLSSSRVLVHIDFNGPDRIFEELPHIHRWVGSPSDMLLKLASHRKSLPEETRHTRDSWIKELQSTLYDYLLPNQVQNTTCLEPAVAVSKLRNVLPENTCLFADAGQHKLYAGYYWKVPGQGRFIASSIVASTGWAIGAAIGAKIADAGIPVAVITGDSCMRMHGFEIQTAVREKIPVIFYVFNNKAMGSVYQRIRNQNIQDRGLVSGYENDWKGFAESVKAYGAKVTREADLVYETQEALRRQDQPSVIEVAIAFPSFNPDSYFSSSAYA